MAEDENLESSQEPPEGSGKTSRREFLQTASLAAGGGLLALTHSYKDLAEKHQNLSARHELLLRQMGDEIASFPDAGVDGFLSHFMISLEFLQGDLAGKIWTLAMPPAAQTVSRSKPFTYNGPSAGHQVEVPLPQGSTLPSTISEADFLNRPAEFFEEGKEVVWMQILNLDSRMNTELGSIRIILGETLKREYPDIFKPSLGIALSLGNSGFPARLFFNPYAIVETPFGAFRAIHGTLAYGRIVAFPPLGTPVNIRSCIPLESVDDVRQGRESLEPLARIIALSHPIDTPMQLSGDEAFGCVERCIAGDRLM